MRDDVGSEAADGGRSVDVKTAMNRGQSVWHNAICTSKRTLTKVVNDKLSSSGV